MDTVCVIMCIKMTPNRKFQIAYFQKKVFRSNANRPIVDTQCFTVNNMSGWGGMIWGNREKEMYKGVSVQ